ncbi:hypothetical protein C2E23DRAFT_569714 [Lenzites betulinus]|nr:hypothetical protein C2E23DRAFT_569714 [Lenzites betulinus]
MGWVEGLPFDMAYYKHIPRDQYLGNRTHSTRATTDLLRRTPPQNEFSCSRWGVFFHSLSSPGPPLMPTPNATEAKVVRPECGCARSRCCERWVTNPTTRRAASAGPRALLAPTPMQAKATLLRGVVPGTMTCHHSGAMYAPHAILWWITYDCRATTVRGIARRSCPQEHEDSHGPVTSQIGPTRDNTRIEMPLGPLAYLPCIAFHCLPCGGELGACLRSRVLSFGFSLRLS